MALLAALRQQWRIWKDRERRAQIAEERDVYRQVLKDVEEMVSQHSETIWPAIRADLTAAIATEMRKILSEKQQASAPTRSDRPW